MSLHTLPRFAALLALLFGLVAVGCPADPSDDDDDSAANDNDNHDDDDAGPDDDDDAAPDDDDAGPDDDDAGPDDDDAGPDDDDSGGGPGPDDDDSSAEGAVLTGNVTRSVEPTGDGIGALHIIVLAEEPTGKGPPPVPVAFTTFPAVDMSGEAASFAYTVYGLTPRPEPYWASAVLDDNNSGGPPDAGDLISTGAKSGPASVVIDTEAGATLDVVLDTVAE